MFGKKLFVELAKAKIQDTRSIVISKNLTFGGYTIAQQVFIEEGKKRTMVFLKGAIQIESLESLYNLRDALNEAIRMEENGTAEK